MKIQQLIYCFISLLFFSCIKDVNTNFDYKNKICVLTHINAMSKQNSLYLANNIALNDSIDNNYLKYIIKDATITISDDQGQSVLITDLQFNGYYTDSSLFKFSEGHSYFISIQTPDGRKARSSMYIPQGTIVKSVDFDTSSLAYNGGSGGNIARDIGLNINFGGSGNYNHAYADVFYSVYFKNTLNFDSTFSSATRFYFNKKATQYLQETTLETTGTIYDYEDNLSDFRVDIDSIVYYIETDDGTYTKFLNSLQKQQAAANDPFAEPALLYSNIKEDGSGIFSGYSVKSKKIKFK